MITPAAPSRPFRRVLLALAATAVLAATATASATAFRHTRLIKSEPADHDTLAVAPKAVRLWFSEKVELGVTTVKLASAAGAAMAVAPLARPDTSKDAPIVAAILKPLAPGAYVIDWSTAATDGHPAKGTIAFVVKAK